MKKGGTGGGNTITGLIYEGKVDLPTYLAQQKGYSVEDVTKKVRGRKRVPSAFVIRYEGKIVARVFKKHGFYQYLEEQGIDWRDYISAQLFPDNSIYVIVNNTFFIIEVKSQHRKGSVDEKLQTCAFKILQYRKLLSHLNVEVQYLYILSRWFEQPQYKDVIDYIFSVQGCDCYFDYIPLQRLGLPVPES